MRTCPRGQMYAEAHANPITHRDRLVTTLAFALLLHALVMRGVTFTTNAGAPAGERALEDVLVYAPTDAPPERADYLADAAQSGAGNIDERVRPRSPDATLGDPTATTNRADGESALDGRFNEPNPRDDRPDVANLTDPLVASTRGHLSFVL